TDVNAQFEKGLLKIDPFTTAANGGVINLGANADFKGAGPVISIPQPISIKGIRINEKLSHEFKGTLAMVNPIFKDIIGLGGTFNFAADKLMMPLAPERKKDIQLTGALSMDNVEFMPTGLLGQILKLVGQGRSRSIANVHPTNFTVKDGFLQYDDAMRIDVGGAPFYYRGRIGLDTSLDMQVELPIGGISLPLGGTIDNPTLDASKLRENLLQDALKGIFEKEGLDKSLLDGLDGLFNK
ncbi:MAG: hypothetical protein ACYS8Z_21640, partial [Planctomycetota bacterium]